MFASSLYRRASQFFGNHSGNTAMIIAMFAPIAAIMAALTVDTSVMASQKREMQGLADISAIAAVSDIDNARGVALRTLADNGFGGVNREQSHDGKLDRKTRRKLRHHVTVQTGHYQPDPKRGYSERFVPSETAPNAVRVTLKEKSGKYFAFFDPRHRSISATGIAAVTAEAGVTVGSRLLSLNDGLLNKLLSGLTGSTIDLTVMDYRGLADADVDLLKTFEALASDLDLSAVTYDDVLEADVSLADYARAIAAASEDSVNATAALGKLARSPDLAQLTVPLSALFDLGSVGTVDLGSPTKGLDLNAKAMQMLMAGAVLSNGANQIDIDLGADVPGLAALRASLLVGERPKSASWFSFSQEKRAIVSTVQTRLFLKASVGGDGLLSHEIIHLPVHLEIASAEAEITNIVCRSGEKEPDRVDVAVRPGILTLRIADHEDDIESFNDVPRFEPANILSTRLVNVRAQAQSKMVSSDWQTLRFYKDDIGSGTPKTVGSRDVLQEALESAVRDLELDVDLRIVSLASPELIGSIVGAVLAEAAKPLDDVLFNLTSVLGIGLGEADIWVHDARCNRAVLVQ
ncbi:TadG family pilus assembly protein [Henriciella aquimarina]|uniref:TadG family pilus assembly protein n=1 Tax=Henriciella aquimarina TaxID=545261 RepID=UPI0013019D90|nr:TadG family pilus assembly protein [Henriciella aquimarina]